MHSCCVFVVILVSVSCMFSCCLCCCVLVLVVFCTSDSFSVRCIRGLCFVVLSYVQLCLVLHVLLLLLLLLLLCCVVFAVGPYVQLICALHVLLSVFVMFGPTGLDFNSVVLCCRLVVWACAFSCLVYVCVVLLWCLALWSDFLFAMYVFLCVCWYMCRFFLHCIVIALCFGHMPPVCLCIVLIVVLYDCIVTVQFICPVEGCTWLWAVIVVQLIFVLCVVCVGVCCCLGIFVERVCAVC